MRLVTVAAGVIFAVSITAVPAFAASSDLEIFNNLIAKRAPDLEEMFVKFKPKLLCVCDPGGTPITQERMGFVAVQNDIISCWRPFFFEGNFDTPIHCDDPWIIVR